MSVAATSGAAPDLVRSLGKAEFGRKWAAFLLVAPLLAFVIVNFAIPVAMLLVGSLYDNSVAVAFPRTLEALDSSDLEGPPGEEAYRDLFADLLEAKANFTLIDAGKRLNNIRPGFNALLNRTARQLEDTAPQTGDYRRTIVDIDTRWLQLEYWQAIQSTGRPLTPSQFLFAFDLRQTGEGDIVRAPADQRVFLRTWLRTVIIAGSVTLLCVFLGYPLAYFAASSSAGVSNVILILVLVPFWTSLLVRTVVWIVLLQNQGLINNLGISLGLWSDPLQLIRNRTGVIITMTHLLLPYLLLPLYAAMKRIPPNYVRAALSLGANPVAAFRDVYFPLTRPALGAGALIVFILAIGFYVTPALVGGPTDQMITYYIAFYTNTVLNWGAAAALSILLLLFTGLSYYIFRVAFGINRVEMN